MNAAFASISVTSMAPPLQSARYFAAVAPPYPAPTTTTFPTPPWRPIDAQPPSETGRAMPHPIAVSRNARRDDAWVDRSLMPRLSARKPPCDELDLLVGVAFRELRHHGAGAPARLELDEARYQFGFAESGERWNLSKRALAASQSARVSIAPSGSHFSGMSSVEVKPGSVCAHVTHAHSA